MNALGPPFQVRKQRRIRARQKGLQTKRLDLIKKRSTPNRVQMRRDLIESQYRIRRRNRTRKSRRLGQNQV